LALANVGIVCAESAAAKCFCNVGFAQADFPNGGWISSIDCRKPREKAGGRYAADLFPAVAGSVVRFRRICIQKANIGPTYDKLHHALVIAFAAAR
jgi:hypothetical protein